jgi:cell division protein FtsN
MAHDYAKKRTAKPQASAKRAKPASSSTPNLRIKYFVLGVISTIVVQLAFHWLQKTPQVDEVVQQVKQVTKPETKQSVKPDITFYQELPKMGVKVDVDVVPDVKNEPYRAVLQAGAFRSAEDANQQRAEIMLMGLNANIESSVNDSGTTWHRVIVGPFTSRSDLNKARNTLANNRVSTLVLKR